MRETGRGEEAGAAPAGKRVRVATRSEEPPESVFEERMPLGVWRGGGGFQAWIPKDGSDWNSPLQKADYVLIGTYATEQLAADAYDERAQPRGLPLNSKPLHALAAAAAHAAPKPKPKPPPPPPPPPPPSPHPHNSYAAHASPEMPPPAAGNGGTEGLAEVKVLLSRITSLAPSAIDAAVEKEGFTIKHLRLLASLEDTAPLKEVAKLLGLSSRADLYVLTAVLRSSPQ